MHVMFYSECTSVSIARVVTASADLMPDGVEEPNTVASWWVSRVIVRLDAMRGKGIGSVVLQRMLREIAENSAIKRVVVAPGGYGASPKKQARFYRKNGFEPVVGADGLYARLV